MPWAHIWWFRDSTIALGSSHFSVTPFLLSLPSGVVRCISSPSVLLCSAGLLCGFLWLCPFFHGLHFGPGGSAPQPGPSSVFPPLSGASATPSVLLSQCLVTVLLSLCSWFVGLDAPGAAAPVPEALVPHLDCLRSRWCLVYISVFGSSPPTGCWFFAGSSPSLLSFRRVLAAPSAPRRHVFLSWVERVRSTHSVAPARSVSLLASSLPGSSLLPPRLPLCSVGSSSSCVQRLRLLLHG